MVCGHCLVTLALTITETLKWLSSLPILMQESFWWWQCSDRYIISPPPPPPPYPPTPFSPSLISLTVSVDVKHHVYLLSVWITVSVHVQNWQCGLHGRSGHIRLLYFPYRRTVYVVFDYVIIVLYLNYGIFSSPLVRLSHVRCCTFIAGEVSKHGA